MGAIVSQRMSRGQANEFLNKLEAAGLTEKLAQRLIDSSGNALAGKVVTFIQNGGYLSSTKSDSARNIMGKNFFGVEDAEAHFGVKPTKSNLDFLAHVPFTEETLNMFRETHVLVAVFPLSIQEIINCVEGKYFRSSIGCWYSDRTFTQSPGMLGWQLLRKEPLPDTFNLGWEKQQLLLDDDEKTPDANVVVYSIIAHFLATGERLLEFAFVHCSDVDTVGHRVIVGGFNNKGIYIKYWPPGPPGDKTLGLASVKKHRQFN